MSEQKTAGEMALADLHNRMAKYSAEIERDQQLSEQEYIEIGRLWNTVSHYNLHEPGAAGARFYELVRDKGIPKMVQALRMVVSRGYSFYSPDFDFALGGIMEARFRYRIPELEKQ